MHSILDLIYPVRCPVCGDIVIPQGDKICYPCREKLVYVTEPRCKKCSKPIELEEKEFCSDCEHKHFEYTQGYAIWVYNDIMKHSISEFKYHNKKEYSMFYVQEIIRHYGKAILKISPDIIVPVPLHKSKLRLRSYNQADILAKGIGKELGIPVLSNLLLRNKKTLPQKQLSDKERLLNLQEAFGYCKDEADRYGRNIRSVLLVDDIYTTGSTIEACTQVLKSQEVQDVYFVTLCIGKGF